MGRRATAWKWTSTGKGDIATHTAALLLNYGIDVASGTADFSGLEMSTGMDFQQEINALTVPSVSLEVYNPADANQRFLTLSSTGGYSNTMSLLALQNIVFAYTSPDVDNSGCGWKFCENRI